MYQLNLRPNTGTMSIQLKNEIWLVNARIQFAIHLCGKRGAKSHYSVEVDFSPEFTTRQEYLAFRASWKRRYMELSTGIRLIRPVVNMALQTMPRTNAFHGGVLYQPHSHLVHVLFYWRMQAKALLAALEAAKRLAGAQRNAKQACSHCLKVECECSDLDAAPGMGAN